MNHTITYKNVRRGQRSASCSCGQRWPGGEPRAVVREAGAHVMGSRQAPAQRIGLSRNEQLRHDFAVIIAQERAWGIDGDNDGIEYEEWGEE
jgi:hypothetical protein